MKYPVLILSAALALLAVAPPPPPPPSQPGSTTTQPDSATTQPGTGAQIPPPSSQSPATAPTDDPNGSLNGLFGPQGGSPKPSSSPGATPSPPPDDRKGLDGVWELQIQRGDNTEYEHFNIQQSGAALTGTYLTQDKKKFPLAGSVDGRNVRLVVSLADGSTIILEGRLDGTTDMLGMLTDAQEHVPFTAAYRPKEKWQDNINAQPGGIGAPGGSGSGYPPR